MAHAIRTKSLTYSAYATPYTEEVLVKLLSDGHAVCRLYGWVTLDYPETITIEDLPELLDGLDPEIGGHVTVIVGCEWDNNNNEYRFLVYDPWNEVDPCYYTYEELAYNVTRINNGSTVQTTLWFPTVVPKTDYTSKTLLEEILEIEYSS